ncbi:MAG: PQQ-binding-like beta-propeller repeat protein [Gemmataceae bacterium]
MATGKHLWKVKHKNEPQLSNITVAGGRVYAASFADPSKERGPSAHGRSGAGEFIALDAKTGKVLWAIPGGTMCKPLYRDEVVYAFRQNALTSLDAGTGKLLWTLPMEETISATGLALSGDFLVVAGFNTTVPLRCINIKERKEAWSFKPEGVSEILSPIICGDLVLVTTAGKVGGLDYERGRTSPIYGLDLVTGNQVWHCAIPGSECVEDGQRRAFNTYVGGWAYPDGKRIYVLSFTGKF